MDKEQIEALVVRLRDRHYVTLSRKEEADLADVLEEYLVLIANFGKQG